MSESAAIGNLKSFFKNAPVGDSVSVEDVFKAYERSHQPEKTNRGWLSNKLNGMKPYDLVESKQSTSTGKTTHLTLTSKGREILGITNTPDYSPHKDDSAQTTEELLETMNVRVETLRKRLPSFDIVFDIKPKGGTR